MKAVILAAGIGKRLGYITEDTPKPMIKLKGKPILEHNIIMCRKAGIREIFINIHYLADKIQNYFKDGAEFGVNITYNIEQKILGTAGALQPFKNALCEAPFFVIYGDNYLSLDLQDLILFHKKMRADISLLLDWREDIRQSGVVVLDKDNRVNRFIEKPKNSDINSNWISAGVYIFNPDIIFDIIKPGFDFGFDVFPKLLKYNCKVYGLKTIDKLCTIDTPKMLKKALSNSTDNSH